MSDKILIVDDEATSLKVVQLILQNSGFETATAKSGEEAFQLADSFHPDLIILDVNMPGGWSGFETCQNFKSLDKFASVPIIFLTANTDHLEQGFELGGADYLLKPLKQQELVVRCRFHLKMRQLVKQVQQANENLESKVQQRITDLTQTNRKLNQAIIERNLLEKRLKFEMGTDFLTQLASGVSFEKQLQQHVDQIQQQQKAAALLYLDLLAFEQINQQFGYEAGDHILINISQLLQSQLGDSAIIGRLGGAQFVVFLKQCNPAEAKKTARALVDCISNFPLVWQQHNMQCEVCIGLYLVDSTGTSARKALSKAMQAALIAKEQGKGEIVTYHPQSECQNLQHASDELYTQLESAINSNKFSLFYQHVHPLDATGHHKGHIEMLLRLKRDASDRLMLPSEFLDVARKSKLSHKIDFWVVSQVLSWLNKERLTKNKIEFVSINLATQTIANPIFIITLENLLNENAIDPNLICFEISEPDALMSINRTRIFLSRVKSLGCRTCIDDFGGQSEIYQYLSEWDIDHLKIDGAVVRNFNQNPIFGLFCEMLKKMADSANKSISVKHLEDKNLHKSLVNIGITHAQGHALHLPEPLSKLA